LLIVGRPEVSVWTAPDGERDGGPIVARLADVAPDGRSTFISAGVAVTAEGEPTRIPLWPVAYRVAPGHRLRVAVSGADFPRLWTTGDEAFDVEKLDVVVPVVPDDAGVPLDMPRPEPPTLDGPPLALSGDRRWGITREPILDVLVVEVAEEVAAYTPGREHILELRQRVRGKTSRLQPKASLIEANNTAIARMSTGETVEVNVSAVMTNEGLRVGTEVSVDGSVVHSRLREL
jgi:hypothetical protein